MQESNIKKLNTNMNDYYTNQDKCNAVKQEQINKLCRKNGAKTQNLSLTRKTERIKTIT